MTYKDHCTQKIDYYAPLEEAALKARNMGAHYRMLYMGATYYAEREKPGSTTLAKMGWLDEDTYELFPERKLDEKDA